MSNLLTNLLIHCGAIAPLNHVAIAAHRAMAVDERVLAPLCFSPFPEDGGAYRPLFIRDEVILEVMRHGSK